MVKYLRRIAMRELDVLIRVHNDNVYIHHNDEWIPIDTSLLESGFSLKSIVILKLIGLKAY